MGLTCCKGAIDLVSEADKSYSVKRNRKNDTVELKSVKRKTEGPSECQNYLRDKQVLIKNEEIIIQISPPEETTPEIEEPNIPIYKQSPEKQEKTKVTEVSDAVSNVSQEFAITIIQKAFEALQKSYNEKPDVKESVKIPSKTSPKTTASPEKNSGQHSLRSLEKQDGGELDTFAQNLAAEITKKAILSEMKTVKYYSLDIVDSTQKSQGFEAEKEINENVENLKEKKKNSVDQEDEIEKLAACDSETEAEAINLCAHDKEASNEISAKNVTRLSEAISRKILGDVLSTISGRCAQEANNAKPLFSSGESRVTMLHEFTDKLANGIYKDAFSCLVTQVS